MSHNLDKSVQCLLRLCLRRLDHNRLMEQKREVDGRSMETIVEESLCDIKGCHSSRLIQQTVKDKLMLAYRLDRKLVAILQRLLDIVCAQHRERSYHTHILLTKHKYICICPQKHTEITHETGYLSACHRIVTYDMKKSVLILNYLRNRQMLSKMGRNTYRA